MSITDQDLGGLVYFARRLRAETYGCGTWDEPGVVAAIREMRGWSLEVALEQILRRGTDPDARTPKAMLSKVTAPLPSERPKYAGPLKPADECPQHIGQPRPPHCATCAVGDVEAYSDTEPVELPPLADVNPGLAERLKALDPKTQEDA